MGNSLWLVAHQMATVVARLAFFITQLIGWV